MSDQRKVKKKNLDEKQISRKNVHASILTPVATNSPLASSSLSFIPNFLSFLLNCQEEEEKKQKNQLPHISVII
jgi:hypothetical protein